MTDRGTSAKRMPVRIRCEGSGYVTPHGLCQMCGRPFRKAATVPEHDRDDVLAMLERGDFD